jgi:uncharacterized HAD superfamily protein
MNRQLVAIDVDKTLTEPTGKECWFETDCLFANPNNEMISLVNELYCKGHIIIITTARPEEFRYATEYWLHKNGVRFHAMNMNSLKKGFDILIDDKVYYAHKPEEIKKYFKI